MEPRIFRIAGLYRTVYGQERKVPQKREHLNAPIAPVEVAEDMDKGEYNGVYQEREEWMQDEVEEEGENEKKVSTATYIPDDWPEIPNQTPPSMFWTCTTCSKTVSLFFRSQHLTSKDHAKHLRKQPQPQSAEPVIPTWQCTICEEAVNVFYKAEHLAGKRHSKALRERGYPQDLIHDGEPPELTAVYQPPGEYPIGLEDISSSCDKMPSPPPANMEHTGKFPVNYNSPGEPSDAECQAQCASTSCPGDVYSPEAYTRESDSAELSLAPETFCCAVCNDKEIPIKNRKYHHGRAWECTICKKTMHSGSKKSHLGGDKHRNRKAKAALVVASFEHIAPSLDHPASTSQQQVEGTEQQVENQTAMPSPTATGAEGTYCEICQCSVDEKQRKFHRGRAWECILCNVTMHIPSKMDHLAGKKHNKKLAL